MVFHSQMSDLCTLPYAYGALIESNDSNYTVDHLLHSYCHELPDFMPLCHPCSCQIYHELSELIPAHLL